MSRSVARSELTLEIGGGHNPAPAADVVVDKFLFDNSQRAGSLRCDRPLVIGDGESLPFRDKAFARTVGRQVMEHMDNVQRFFQELMRGLDGVRRVCHSLRRARIRSAIDLDALLACPLCKQAVRREGERYVCGECGRRYPIVRGIPVMLANAEAADAVVEHARRAA